MHKQDNSFESFGCAIGSKILTLPIFVKRSEHKSRDEPEDQLFDRNTEY